MTQLNIYVVRISSDPFIFCAVTITVGSISTNTSTWLILSMTFERFYSIIRPHKAATFNTVKRARIVIVGIVIIFVLYSVPLLFMTTPEGRLCFPYTKGMDHLAVKIYTWADQVVGFAFPFIALLIMNSVIIHTLRKRSKLSLTRSDTQAEGQGQNEGHLQKMKSSEKQIITMLLLVTFGFLILMTPMYTISFYSEFFDYTSSPKSYAGFFLYMNIAKETFCTNSGINFYLYVISGQKFRSDLIKLFRSLRLYFCKERNQSLEEMSRSVTKSSSLRTEITSQRVVTTSSTFLAVRSLPSVID